MRTRLLALMLLSAAMTSAAHAQTAAPATAPAAAPQPDIIFVTAAETQALIAKAKAERAKDRPSSAPQPLVRVPGYRAVVEYRVASTPASIHDNNAEFFYVLEGSGDMVLGGALIDAKRTNPANQSGTGVTGGDTRKLGKGDFIFVPAGMPHYFSAIGSDGLAVVALHVPGQVPAH
jgi:mannose-6-phosphate isomerase-like protein (cupin superfamily)